MPVYLSGNQTSDQQAGNQILQEDLGYDYPNELNLRPNSELHKMILQRILDRAQTSRRVMSRYKDRWRDIDDVLRVYMNPDSSDDKSKTNRKKSQGKDYADLIIPESYATMETVLTYYMASFMQDPMINYEGVSPKDVVGARLMTLLIDHQVKQAKMGLNIHTMLRDDTAYGFGVLAPTWRRYYGRRPKLRQLGMMREDGVFEITQEERTYEDNVLLYEGNEVMNINPYLYLPDVTVPIHEPQKGEYVGWVEETGLTSLLRIENDNDSMLFNVRYLTKLDNRSQFTMTQKQNTRDEYHAESPINVKAADVIWMYIDLVPFDWELGDSEYPEKWLFAVAGDKVIISAQKVDYMHGKFPVVVSASNFDGYSATPVSKLSMVHDVQTLINFMYTSHVHNVRKALNDMFIVDPSIINYYDIINPEPGKVIRTRRAAWGNQMLDHAFKQLDVRDVTQNHTAEADHLGQIMRRISATGDNMQGSFQDRTTRVSAREAGSTIGASLSRFQKNAQIIDMQAMQPLAFMLAAHTQEFMEMETYLEVTGDWNEKYYVDLADQDNRILVHPLDLLINYNIRPTNGKIPGSEDPQTWTQLFQIASSNPIIAQQLDWMKLFKHLGRNLGASNVDEFIVRVEPDEEVMQQQAMGNIVDEQAA